VPGGRFAGHLLGDRDNWAGGPDASAHARSEVEDLIAALHVEHFEVTDEAGTSYKGPKRWHYFSVIAGRPQNR
jgi:hypothetical protein